jgi:hypothetical protein
MSGGMNRVPSEPEAEGRISGKNMKDRPALAKKSLRACSGFSAGGRES